MKGTSDDVAVVDLCLALCLCLWPHGTLSPEWLTASGVGASTVAEASQGDCNASRVAQEHKTHLCGIQRERGENRREERIYREYIENRERRVSRESREKSTTSKARADVNATNPRGETPLLFASHRGGQGGLVFVEVRLM